ncbi:hypothetical protein I546_3054 [Mycobacterium kansasii 732]|uniref:DUF5642 domain-containing protein n=1 Tax=Mycobacterium pseudokansasii TaxID=2341080 RepID=A0A498QTJ0_9MYCO|nr:DUF5642 family protein [Mycobacterium pseudokansasii]EUA11475.1 hypothetical protein I546_3054 [Mycobacterium kansasii 732]KZS61036.1 hypothetical protein A4G27_08105 [Mycobacterium kansasii]MBY0388356.1 DUF5642 family protein [Mycobacterium pseudokansasii]VBA30038.1 hypothetical protein LAUMK35_04613 [Mycobacterium pseudokansasii]VBA31586.1 hypothetical protein LAUMK21_04606 [Mycobacterium pseudokansasii]
MSKVVLALAAVCLLVGCSPGASQSTKADIAKVIDVKSSFGPGFTVNDVPPRAIDPQFFAARKLPDGLSFDPANCAKAALGPQMPPGVQGNMAAVSAEGNGNRFVVIAVETSQQLPFNDPGKECGRIAFSGAQVRGGIEVVATPHIDGAQTLGVHRVLQALVDGSARTGELYDYSAQFGYYQVNVIANPLVVPNQPVAPVDVQRARDLLVKAVAAIRG